MKRPAATILLLFAVACTSQRFDKDQGTHEYYNRPNAFTSPNTPIDPRTDAPVLALLGVAALGMNPGYYDKSSLGGRCVVRNSLTDPLGAPCNNIVVILLDHETRKEVSRVPCSSDGSFYFVVNRGRKYLIGVASERYHLPEPDQGPFVQGQELLLTLRPIESGLPQR
jgi:hypothetical protein